MLTTIVISFCSLCALLAVGKFLRVKVLLFQKLYLPSSVIAGLLGLIVLNTLPLFGCPISPDVTAGWDTLPGFLICVVFAALFLGVKIPGLKFVWQKAGPQLAYGQIVAWGQYVVGIGLSIFLLSAFFELSPAFGAIVPVGFEGGHGTAGGLAAMFEAYNWPEGRDFGLASATVGLFAGIVIGMGLVNWAIRRGHTEVIRNVGDLDFDCHRGVYPPDERPSAGQLTVTPDSVDTVALHLAIVGIAIFIGFGIKQLLLSMPESTIRDLINGFPLFPLAMIGGLIVQKTIDMTAKTDPVDHGIMQRISGAALDFLVVAAVATMRLAVIRDNWIPFAAIVAGGIIWNVFCVTWLARRLLPNCWFERAIAEMGQSMGVTATGLLLLRAVDPKGETDAPAAFGYKQLLHEPFMGGGLWTSSAIALMFDVGPLPVFLIAVAAIVVWLIVWRLALRPAPPAA